MYAVTSHYVQVLYTTAHCYLLMTGSIIYYLYLCDGAAASS